MTIPGNSKTSGSSEKARQLIWLCLIAGYAAGVAGDFAWHLPGRGPTPARVAVAVSAALFWPLDLVAQGLLSIEKPAP